MTQSVKHVALELRVVGSGPTLGSTHRGASAWDSLSPSAHLSVHWLALSQIKSFFKKDYLFT